MYVSLLLALFLPSRFHLACACYAFGLPTWLQDLLLWKGDVGLGLADELQLEGMFHESNAVRAFLIMPPIDFETISGEVLFDILMYSPPPQRAHPRPPDPLQHRQACRSCSNSAGLRALETENDPEEASEIA